MSVIEAYIDSKWPQLARFTYSIEVKVSRQQKGSYKGPPVSTMPKKRSQDLTSESFEGLLTHLADSPDTYTPEELSDSLAHLFNPDSCTEFQIGAFLALLRASGLEGRPDMISMAAQSMRERAVRVELEQDGWADLVGTGGDGKDTFNVSTTAALVAAGAGVKICKVSSESCIRATIVGKASTARTAQ